MDFRLSTSCLSLCQKEPSYSIRSGGNAPRSTVMSTYQVWPPLTMVLRPPSAFPNRDLALKR